MFCQYFVLFAIVIVSATAALYTQDTRETEKVSVKFCYESLCRYCIAFWPEFVKVTDELHQYLDIHIYPYGNAHVTKNADGSVTFECQHGEPECYGNILHACAIDVLTDETLYLDYNACLMQNKSNDTAAVKCGQDINIETGKVDNIKNCAKGARGQELFVHYGQESDAVNFDYVPYVLLNNNEWTGENGQFKQDVCSAFSNPPAPCLSRE